MNPIEHHIQAAVEAGHDFALVCWAPHLIGLPHSVREEHPGAIKLQFDVPYHAQSVGTVQDGVLTVHVSFDALYTIGIPLQAVAAFLLEQQVPKVLERPTKPEPAQVPPRSHLRLVEPE